jgi:MoaA/NifB/PqqE/SkfB family radical SAM enzyme
MRIVELVLTSRCNCSCHYCFYSQQKNRRVPDRFDPGNIEAVLEALPSIGVTDLVVSGGEPLLRLDLVRACLRAGHRAGVAIWLSSNGLLADAEIASQLAREGLRAVHLSLDKLGADPYRGYSEKQARRVLQAARCFQEAGVETVGLICVIGRHNRDDIGALLEFAVAQGLEIVFQPMFAVDGIQEIERLADHEWSELAPVLTRWAGDGYFASYLDLWLNYYARRARPAQCAMGMETIVIDSDGQAYVCFHRRDLVAGNVLTDDLDEIDAALQSKHAEIQDAHCFGEHCVSLFT